MSNADLYGASRKNSWRIDLLDLDRRLVDTLDMASERGLPGVQPGVKFERASGTDLKESANATILRRRDQALDWTQFWLRLWYTGAGADPVVPLATLVPTAAPETHPTTHVEEKVELHSALTLVTENGPGGVYGIDAGAVGSEVLAEILGTHVGLDSFAIAPSTDELNAGLTFDPETSWLSICNKVCSAIGFWSLRPDPWGVIHADRYVRPADRAVSWVFDDHPERSLYMPGWTRDRDLLLPNRVVVIQKVEGDVEPIDAEAVLPDSHPRSAAHIGRTITRVFRDVDFATEEAGALLAWQKLENIVPGETRVVEHPWLPDVEPNAVVVHQRDGIPDMRGTVASQSVMLETGGLFKTEIRGSL